MVLYVVRDLLFVSKIREAAEPLGVAVTGVRDVETLATAARGVRLVILDLALSAAAARARGARDDAGGGRRADRRSSSATSART